MGKAQARRGDRYIGKGSHGAPGCPHKIVGKFVGGSDDVYVNNKRAIHVQSRGISMTCPHHTAGDFAATGSNIVLINNKQAHRRGDRVRLICGWAKTVEGSPDVFTGG